MDERELTSPFVYGQALISDHRRFCAGLIGSALVYLLLSVWLNSIRATVSPWFGWPLFFLQFVLYCFLFSTSYQRSVVFGLNKHIALVLFVIFASLGRVNDWEVVILPSLIITMVLLSARNKKSITYKTQ